MKEAVVLIEREYGDLHTLPRVTNGRLPHRAGRAYACFRTAEALLGVVLSSLLLHVRKDISLHTNLAGGSGAISRGKADEGRQHMRYTWIGF